MMQNESFGLSACSEEFRTTLTTSRRPCPPIPLQCWHFRWPAEEKALTRTAHLPGKNIPNNDLPLP